MSRSPTIRVASFADLPQVTSLRQQWSANRGFRGDTGEFAERVRQWWERQGDSRSAGWRARPTLGLRRERLGGPGSPAQGVATALMTAVIDWCRARSFERIVLNPSQMSVPMYHGLRFRPADELLRLDP